MFSNLIQEIRDDDESTYYFTESMIMNNVLIEAIDIDNGDFFETWISVFHLNQLGSTTLDAAQYIIFNGEYLRPIQVYSIVKDIAEIYHLKNGLKGVDSVTVQWQTSSMQSDLDSSNDILYRIKDKVEFVKEAWRDIG